MMKRERKKFWMIFLIILLGLLFLVAVYFAIQAYKTPNASNDLAIFQEGFNYGYEQAITQIINLSTQCRPFPVFVRENSVDLIAVNCLQ